MTTMRKISLIHLNEPSKFEQIFGFIAIEKPKPWSIWSEHERNCQCDNSSYIVKSVNTYIVQCRIMRASGSLDLLNDSVEYGCQSLSSLLVEG